MTPTAARRASARATSTVAARSPVTLSTVANVSGNASTAMRIPIPSTGSPIAVNSGASMMNAPRGTPGDGEREEHRRERDRQQARCACSGTP